jgi:hypothetical protein
MNRIEVARRHDAMQEQMSASTFRASDSRQTAVGRDAPKIERPVLPRRRGQVVSRPFAPSRVGYRAFDFDHE